MLSFRSFTNKLISEDTVDVLKNTKKVINTAHDDSAEHKEPYAIIDHFAAHDPNPKKKNLPWIINQYHKGNLTQNQGSSIHDTLTNFEKHKDRLPNKDINSYNHIADVVKAVEPHLGTVSNKEAKRTTKHEGAELIHDSEHLSVHKIKTEKAACHYGAGTKWCTSGNTKNMFNHHNAKGSLYVIHDKKNNQKYQLQLSSGELKNAEDKRVRPRDLVKNLPDVKNVEEFNKSPSIHSLDYTHDRNIPAKLHTFLKDKHLDSMDKSTAFNHPLLDADHLSTVMQHGDVGYRSIALSHPKANADHYSMGMKDKDSEIRRQAETLLKRKAS